MLQHFKKKPPEHDIWFVFFDEEEGGINGSNWFVQQHPHLMARPMLNVNLDMIGRPKDGVVFVTGGLLDPALGKAVKSIPESDRIRIKFEGDGPEYDGRKNWRTSSDHKHFYERDVPFLFIHTGVHEDYHRPSDDVKKINLEDYTAVVNWTIKLVEKLSDNLGALAKIPSESSA
jgi:Zn-dependent M28 family amino/carboxypeptidase